VKLRLLVFAVAALAASPSAQAAPRVDARAYLVQNAATGEVLLSRGAERRLPIASITKLMTVLVVLERARPDDLVTVGPDASSVGESTVHLRPGEQLTVRDLVEAALIQSANDAANALADHVGEGDRAGFVELMNEKARALGLRDTRFVRPDGLDVEGHYSSARDVTTLARVAMRSPLVREIVARRTETIAGGRRLHTWNDLLASFPGLIGVKTGHTSAAGWCEVAAARGRGVTIYATVLGSSTRAGRNGDLAELLAWGISRYRVVSLVEQRRVYARAAAPYGREPLSLVASRPLVRVVRVDRPLVERVVAPTAVELPVRRGQRLGWVRVYERGRLVASRPLVAARTIERPGLGGRLAWYAERTLHHLTGVFS
jgi:serine-type D-Ala-D-Ala carboxypeptidase (penicillin-binding protein 5/6)